MAEVISSSQERQKLEVDRELNIPASAAPHNAVLPQDHHGNETWNWMAHNAGSALGSTVYRVRSGLHLVTFPRTKQNVPANTHKTALDSSSQNFKMGIASQLGTSARKVRVQYHRIQQDHPIQVILACAATAFVVGFGLRIWRSSRD